MVKLFSGLNSACFSKILLLLLLSVCGQAAGAILSEAPYENTPISDIRIEIQDFYGSREYWTGMVQAIALPYIRKGDPFSGLQVNRLTAALKSCRRFRLIHLDTEMTESGLALLIAVTPFRMIRDIRIHGKYPLFEKQIFNAMTLYPGDAFVVEEVDRQAGLIAELYRRYGYIDPKVRIERVENPEDGHYFLNVFIEKGRWYRLRRFVVTGNKAFKVSRLRWKMKSVRGTGQKFSEKSFLEDLEKLRAFYRGRGFADVVVEHELDRRLKTGDVTIKLMVNEGARYDISFVGNTAFGSRALKKELDLFKSGNRRGTGLRRSLRNIKEKYLKAGYAQVTVNVKTEDVREQGISVRRLSIVIDEGVRSIVREIVISGNTLFSEEELNKQMLTRLPGWIHDGEYVAERFEEDIMAIENLYQGSGYLNVDLQKTLNFSPDRADVGIHLKISEGNQTMVTRVNLEGLTAMEAAAVKKAIQIKAHEPFSRSKLNNDEKRIAVMVSEKGYPYVQVSGNAGFNEDRTQCEVVFRVRQNTYVKRGNTFHAGNFRTKEKVLNRELMMKPGDPFSLKKMLEGQQNIRAMNIFRSVAFNPWV